MVESLYPNGYKINITYVLRLETLILETKVVIFYSPGNRLW